MLRQKEPLSDFNSTPSGTSCGPFIVLELRKKTICRSPSFQAAPRPLDKQTVSGLRS